MNTVLKAVRVCFCALASVLIAQLAGASSPPTTSVVISNGATQAGLGSTINITTTSSDVDSSGFGRHLMIKRPSDSSYQVYQLDWVSTADPMNPGGSAERNRSWSFSLDQAGTWMWSVDVYDNDSGGVRFGDSAHCSIEVTAPQPPQAEIAASVSATTRGNTVTITTNTWDRDSAWFGRHLMIKKPSSSDWEVYNLSGIETPDPVYPGGKAERNKTWSFVLDQSGVWEWRVDIYDTDSGVSPRWGTPKSTSVVVSETSKLPPEAEIVASVASANRGSSITVTTSTWDRDSAWYGRHLMYKRPSSSDWEVYNLSGIETPDSVYPGGRAERNKVWPFVLDQSGVWEWRVDVYDTDSGVSPRWGSPKSVSVVVSEAPTVPPTSQIACSTNTAATGDTVTIVTDAWDPDSRSFGRHLRIKKPTDNDWVQVDYSSVTTSDIQYPAGSAERVRAWTFNVDTTGTWQWTVDVYDNDTGVVRWGNTSTISVAVAPGVATSIAHQNVLGQSLGSSTPWSVGDLAAIQSTASGFNNITRHKIRIKRPQIAAETVYFQFANHTLPSAASAWSDEGWGAPLGGLDLGNRAPFTEERAGVSNSVSSATMVLDAPGTWEIRSQVTSSSGETSSVSQYINVGMPAMPSFQAAPAYPKSTSKYLGAYYNAGQTHRGYSSRDEEFRLAWQPGQYDQKDNLWDARWGAHQVRAIIPDGLGSSILSGDIVSRDFAKKMALRLMDVGVDFLIIDHSNILLKTDVATDPVLDATDQLSNGFADAASQASRSAVKLVFMLSMCNSSMGDEWPNRANATDVDRFNQKLQAIYDRYAKDPNKYFYPQPENKPLLLLWSWTFGPTIDFLDGTTNSNGKEVFNPSVSTVLSRTAAGEADDPLVNDQGISGFGKLKTTYSDKFKVTVNGQSKKMTEVFMIRYVAANASIMAGEYEGSYVAPGETVARNHIKTGHWLWCDVDPTPATLRFNSDGAVAGVEAAFAFPKVIKFDPFSVVDRFSLQWNQETGQPPSSPLNQYNNGAGYNAALNRAVRLNPRFLVTAFWYEFGSWNDERRPEWAYTIGDNNKFGVYYGDLLKSAAADWRK
jgi:hypothetical protein